MMYDINLFERYKVKPKKTNYFTLFFVLILIILLAGIGYSEYKYYTEKNTIQSQIDELKDFSTDPKTIKLLADIETKTVINQETKNNLQKLYLVDNYANFSNVVSEEFLTEISNAVPENCFVNKLSIASDNVSLAGFADSFETVANFEHRLRKTSRLTMLFNPGISEENANYSYTFSARLRKEINDED